MGTFDYRAKSSIWLPMNMGSHDATKLRTLDLSGNDNHATFGDGSTVGTYPTKLTYRKGYSFDGTTDYFKGVDNKGLFGSEKLTFVFEFTPDFETSDNVDSPFFDSDGGVGQSEEIRKLNNASANVLRIRLGTTSVASIAEATYSPYWRKGQRNILFVVGDTANDLNNAWLNEGHILVDNAVDWAVQNDGTVFWVGSNTTPNFFFSGEYHTCIVLPLALTPLQVRDLDRRLLADYMRQV